MPFANQNTASPKTPDLLIPNPKLRLREQVREVMRFKHYAVRTEETYWGCPQGARMNGVRWFIRREEDAPRRTPAASPFGQFVVRGLKCDCSLLPPANRKY